MIKVIIADDHPLVKEGIRNVFRKSDEDIVVQSQAANQEELMKQLEKGLPDLLILDIAFPDKSGIDILKDVSKKYENLPVLMLSMHPAERFGVRSLKAGADGYLNKESITEKLIDAVNQIVHEDRKYINETVAEQLASELNGRSEVEPHKKLSEREFQVMCMVASGMMIQEIADELSLSSRTVHTYRSRLMDKMDLRSDVAITRYALSKQLIDEP